MSEEQVDQLSPVGHRVLLSLAEYRFLTAAQMIKLGVARDKGHLFQVLAGLMSVKRATGNKTERRPKEIGELDFGVLPTKGRLPRLHYLTKRGAELLALVDTNVSHARFPQRVVKFANDYEHRVRTVDFHIELNQSAASNDHELVWARQYFDHSASASSGSSFRSTRIRLSDQSINPDSIYMLRSNQGVEKLVCVEIANGMDSGRNHRQIRRYAQALHEGAINRAFDFGNRAARIAYVFEHERLLELVVDRLRNDIDVQRYAPHFFFRPAQLDAEKDLNEGWTRLSKTHAISSLFGSANELAK